MRFAKVSTRSTRALACHVWQGLALSQFPMTPDAEPMAAVRGTTDAVTEVRPAASPASAPPQSLPSIVFLDIDGVICLGSEQQTLEPLPLCALKTLCDAAAAEVVVSSDWRRNAELYARLVGTLQEHGIRCIGSTPRRSRGQELRPVEIREWLEANRAMGRLAWVALDDRYLPAETGGAIIQPLNFVHVDPRFGLTPALAETALRQIRAQRRQQRAEQRGRGVATEGAATGGLATPAFFLAPPACPWVLLDVDGTCETGEPHERARVEANRRLPPLGRSYNYNEPLFRVLRRAQMLITRGTGALRMRPITHDLFGLL